MKSCCKEVEDNITDQEEPENQGWLARLRNKWQVKNILQVVLILCTFAIGGTMCSFVGKRIMTLTGLEGGALWVIIYILMVTILWPLCVLLISIPFGQFQFFRKYLRKLGNRIIRRQPTGKE